MEITLENFRSKLEEVAKELTALNEFANKSDVKFRLSAGIMNSIVNSNKEFTVGDITITKKL